MKRKLNNMTLSFYAKEDHDATASESTLRVKTTIRKPAKAFERNEKNFTLKFVTFDAANISVE